MSNLKNKIKAKPVRHHRGDRAAAVGRRHEAAARGRPAQGQGRRDQLDRCRGRQDLDQQLRGRRDPRRERSRADPASDLPRSQSHRARRRLDRRRGARHREPADPARRRSRRAAISPTRSPCSISSRSTCSRSRATCATKASCRRRARSTRRRSSSSARPTCRSGPTRSGRPCRCRRRSKPAPISFKRSSASTSTSCARTSSGLRAEGITDKLGVIIGVGPIRSAKSARWMNENLFGVTVPEPIIARLEAAQRSGSRRPACLRRADRGRCEQIQGVAGAHVMAPAQGTGRDRGRARLALSASALLLRQLPRQALRRQHRGVAAGLARC